MIEPLPYCFSICEIAASNAFNLSSFAIFILLLTRTYVRYAVIIIYCLRLKVNYFFRKYVRFYPDWEFIYKKKRTVEDFQLFSL